MADTLLNLNEPAHARAAFQHRDFRLFQGARLASIVSLESLSLAVAWQVYEITKSPLMLGYVGLLQFLPAILLSLAAGHVADRFDRKNILVLCNSLYGLSAVLLFIYERGNPTTVSPIFAIVSLIGVVRAFSGPASQALMPQLVPAHHFQNAVAWSSSIFMVATILGPTLGGVVYGIGKGAAPVFATSFILYLVAIACAFAIHTQTGRMEKKNVSAETILAGFKYVWEQKLILGSVSMDLFAVLLGGAVALMPVFADEILHAGPTGLAILRAAPAVGAAMVGGWMAYKPLKKDSGAVMFFCVAMFGVFTVVFGLSKTTWLSVVAMFAIGAFDMVSVIIRSTLVQINTPPEMRGRVSAVNLLFIGASNELGEFESGLTAHWFGVVPAVVIGGLGTVIIVTAWAFLFPELRKVQQLHMKN